MNMPLLLELLQGTSESLASVTRGNSRALGHNTSALLRNVSDYNTNNRSNVSTAVHDETYQH
jgi:hypothetical protein